jgi:hypothetical protein
VKYVILIYHNARSRDVWNAFTDAQRAAGIQAHMQLVEDLTESTELVLPVALAEPSEGARVSQRAGAVSTDGPFAEAKEHLAGFYLVDCDSLSRAVAIGGRIPEAAFGLVEVRPLLARGGDEM